jgi:hypothetical protein
VQVPREALELGGESQKERLAENSCEPTPPLVGTVGVNVSIHQRIKALAALPAPGDEGARWHGGAHYPALATLAVGDPGRRATSAGRLPGQYVPRLCEIGRVARSLPFRLGDVSASQTWPKNAQRVARGVISRTSALDLHDLCDLITPSNGAPALVRVS